MDRVAPVHSTVKGSERQRSDFGTIGGECEAFMVDHAQRVTGGGEGGVYLNGRGDHLTTAMERGDSAQDMFANPGSAVIGGEDCRSRATSNASLAVHSHAGSGFDALDKHFQVSNDKSASPNSSKIRTPSTESTPYRNTHRDESVRLPFSSAVKSHHRNPSVETVDSMDEHEEFYATALSPHYRQTHAAMDTRNQATAMSLTKGNSDRFSFNGLVTGQQFAKNLNKLKTNQAHSRAWNIDSRITSSPNATEKEYVAQQPLNQSSESSQLQKHTRVEDAVSSHDEDLIAQPGNHASQYGHCTTQQQHHQATQHGHHAAHTGENMAGSSYIPTQSGHTTDKPGHTAAQSGYKPTVPTSNAQPGIPAAYGLNLTAQHILELQQNTAGLYDAVAQLSLNTATTANKQRRDQRFTDERLRFMADHVANRDEMENHVLQLRQDHEERIDSLDDRVLAMQQALRTLTSRLDSVEQIIATQIQSTPVHSGPAHSSASPTFLTPQYSHRQARSAANAANISPAKTTQSTPTLTAVTATHIPDPADDVFAPGPSARAQQTPFEQKDLAELVHSCYVKVELLVRNLATVPLHGRLQHTDVQPLVALCGHHLDSRRQALHMLQDDTLRVPLLVGALARTFTVSTLDQPVLTDHPNRALATRFDALFKEEHASAYDIVNCTNIQYRYSLAVERARLADIISNTSGFYAWLKDMSYAIANHILSKFTVAIPRENYGLAYANLQVIVLEALKISVRMYKSPKFYETAFYRYGLRWDWKRMVQRNPELQGHPCHQQPPIYVIRTSMAPWIGEKDLTTNPTTEVVIHKPEVILCDRKGNLR